MVSKDCPQDSLFRLRYSYLGSNFRLPLPLFLFFQEKNKKELRSSRAAIWYVLEK